MVWNQVVELEDFVKPHRRHRRFRRRHDASYGSIAPSGSDLRCPLLRLLRIEDPSKIPATLAGSYFVRACPFGLTRLMDAPGPQPG